jgi:hypothetical protein
VINDVTLEHVTITQDCFVYIYIFFHIYYINSLRPCVRLSDTTILLQKHSMAKSASVLFRPNGAVSRCGGETHVR